ncbi:MAG: hypothetical protein J7L23_00905 [Candidatus Diapherotrites archaeon]|nr:hypothetical protein [Candidatus Diapherotrites archaeon]
MGIGRFEKRLIASAKLASMEKYGYCYSEDLAVVKEYLRDEVEIEESEGNRVTVTRNGISFEIDVRGMVPKKTEVASWAIQPAEERRGKWVSVFDPANH